MLKFNDSSSQTIYKKNRIKLILFILVKYYIEVHCDADMDSNNKGLKVQCFLT